MGIIGFYICFLLGALACHTAFSRIRVLGEELELLRSELRQRLHALEKLIEQQKQPATVGKAPPAPEPTPPPLPEPEVLEQQPAEAAPAFKAATPVGMRAEQPRFESKVVHARVEMEPDPFTILFGKIRTYFTTGNTLVKVGVVLIFFGVSFLLKYAIDNGMLPIELRLAATAVFGLVLLRLGWNLRNSSREYGLVLQGGGIGILMLTTFVALKSYALIPPTLAFFLLVAFTVATAVLAVKQDSLNLAAFGLLGGFLAPILASTGQGQHVVLFTYYAILNLGVIGISWEKAWRELNLLGFLFTFVISAAWGVLKYSPELYWSTQPFLILFFLIYIAIPLIFAQKKEPELRGYVDGTIVFGNSIFTLALQLQLVKPFAYGGAFSALVLAAFYIFLSRYLLRHRKENYRLLAEAFVSIGTVFVTIAIPLAFDGLKTSAIWAFEAAGIYWVALHQDRPLARFFSTFLLFATSVSFFLGPQRGSSDLIFLNTFFLSCLFMAAGAYAISYLGGKYRSKLSDMEAWVPVLSFTLGTLWWIYGGLYEIDRFTFPWWPLQARFEDHNLIPVAYLLNAQLVYLTAGALVTFFVGRALEWRKPQLLAHAFFFVLLLVFLRGFGRYSHSFESFGYVAWAFAFAAYYYILHAGESGFAEPRGWFFRFGHAGALWALVGVLVRESHWLGATYVGENSAWGVAAQGIAPILAIWLVTENSRLLPWPLERHRSIYLRAGLAPVVALSMVWLLFTNWFQSGGSDPLPYVPVLNPLELVHLGMLFATTVWAVRLLGRTPAPSAGTKQQAGILLGLIYFFWLNGVLCRAVHHYSGVPFQFDSLFDSVVVQVSFSLFWTLLGIALMIFASRRAIRWLWLTGAGLLGVVVAKMFLIDLSKTETIARVISFIGVGVLFLVVGYFSPIPPKKEAQSA